MPAERTHSDALGEPAGPVIDRRTLLAATGGLAGLGTLGTPIAQASAFAASSSDPVSMAMHVHGSFSEGIASMDAHLDQARRLGVDVVWWTDHDFRLDAFGYRTSIGFDGPHEGAGGWDLTWVPRTDPGIGSSDYAFVSSPANPDESGNKLRVQATARDSSDWSSFLMEAQAQNATYSTSYCDTTLTVDVRSAATNPDVRAVIEVVSSYRPARGGRPAGQYRIQYRVGQSSGYSTEEHGLLGVVSIPSTGADRWQRVTRDLRDDHARLWPDTVADDASLWRLRLGAQVRNGSSAQVFFDRLRLDRDRNAGVSGMDLLRDVADQYRERYPTIVNYPAAEVSLVLHLNAFGGDLAMPNYPGSQAHKDSSPAAQRAMVDFLHRHGATVSLNHPLQGAKGPHDLAARLIHTRGQGADVIEVGLSRKTTERMVRVFDLAARNAVFMTANGTTDDHRGTDWLKGRRWLTRVWSRNKTRSGLAAALEAGRAWFYDPRRWDGAFDLRVEGRARMGSVLFTGKRDLDLSVRATDLPRGSHVYLVVGQCDLAGPRHLKVLNDVRGIPAKRFAGGRWSGRVSRGHGAYVRATVRDAHHNLIAFSNPVWVLPESRRGQVDVPPRRR
jgi:hypothetical protein